MLVPSLRYLSSGAFHAELPVHRWAESTGLRKTQHLGFWGSVSFHPVPCPPRTRSERNPCPPSAHQIHWGGIILHWVQFQSLCVLIRIHEACVQWDITSVFSGGFNEHLIKLRYSATELKISPDPGDINKYIRLQNYIIIYSVLMTEEASL